MGNTPHKLRQQNEEVDPNTGLTPYDVQHIQTTWKSLNKPEVAEELFLRLFKAHPETKAYFKFFKDKSDDELKNSSQLKAHAILFMNSLNNLIKNLHKPDIVVALADKLANTHKKYNIPKKYNRALKEIFEIYLKKETKLTSEQLHSWDKFLDFLKRSFVNVK